MSVSATLRLPEFAPNGPIPLRITAVDRNTGLALELEKPAEETVTVTIDRYPANAIKRPAVSGALGISEQGLARFSSQTVQAGQRCMQ